MEKAIENKTQEIELVMSALGRRLKAGDESQILHWVISDRLACAYRPLRYHPLYGGSGKNLTLSATKLVIDWVTRVQNDGVKSIISLMHDRDLHYYEALNLGVVNLIEYYKQQGFQVSHIPWEDPHHKKSHPSEKRKTFLRVREEALKAYDVLIEPVMVQCSAGIDRSSPVAAYIYVKRA